MAELVLLVAVTLVPFGAGFLAVRLGRPWWWGAAVAVVLVVLAAVVPTPEAGEERLRAGDLPFLAVVAALVTLIAWLGARVARGLGRRHAGL